MDILSTTCNLKVDDLSTFCKSLFQSVTCNRREVGKGTTTAPPGWSSELKGGRASRDCFVRVMNASLNALTAESSAMSRSMNYAPKK